MDKLSVFSKFTLRRWPLVAASGILALSMILCTRPPVEERGVATTNPTPTATGEARATFTPTSPLVKTGFPTSEQVLVVSSGSVAVGQTISLDLMLTRAPEGISGFDVSVEVANKEVGELVAVEFANFGLTDQLPLGEAQGMRLRAVDLQNIIPLGAEGSKLATLQVKGKKQGITQVRLSLNRMDDEDGDPVTPEIVLGQLQVTSP